MIPLDSIRTGRHSLSGGTEPHMPDTGTLADPVVIRPARAADAASIAAIWNPIIRDTTITFTTVEKTPDDIARMIAERDGAGQAFLVAEIDGVVAGFAAYGPFRSGPGYVRTAEHTVLLGPAARGRNVGRRLMAALEEHARAAGIVVMIGGVSGENLAGIAFHQALGYADDAVLTGVGWKFGRALDLHLMAKSLAR